MTTNQFTGISRNEPPWGTINLDAPYKPKHKRPLEKGTPIPYIPKHKKLSKMFDYVLCGKAQAQAIDFYNKQSTAHVYDCNNGVFTIDDG